MKNSLILMIAILTSAQSAFAGYGCKQGQYCPPSRTESVDSNVVAGAAPCEVYGTCGGGYGPTTSDPSNGGGPIPRALVEKEEQVFSTIINCDQACASCGPGQACYCNPATGYSCGQTATVYVNDQNGTPIRQGNINIAP
jgi:hypothetical protein